MKRKTYLIVFFIIALFIIGGAIAFLVPKEHKEKEAGWHILSAENADGGIKVQVVGENHMKRTGIKVKADSEENEKMIVAMIRDGIVDDAGLRWSSDNDWEDTEHWIQVSFKDEVPVGCIRLYWERLNAIKYAIEVSDDGKEWETVAEFNEAPQAKCQDILLDKSIETAFLRLHVFDVSKSEKDGSLYFQNVSLLEMEVYGLVEDDFLIEVPKVDDGEKRKLVTPDVPEKYELAFVGADYETVVDEDGNIADTLSDVQVEVGYRLCREGKTEELPAFQVMIPGNEEIESIKPAQEEARKNGDGQMVQSEIEMIADSRSLPEGYSPMEWKAATGSYNIGEDFTIFVDRDEKLKKVADIFAEELKTQTGNAAKVIVCDEQNSPEKNGSEGDFYLKLSDENVTVEEGFQMSLGTEVENMTVIEGKTLQGIRWGCVSLLELLEKCNTIPKGIIRDYPRYAVRGFGIDVARRPISMDTLYHIVETMSRQKMNTLQVHLNDNQIISQSDFDGTRSGALKLYAGFRLESDITNKEGVGLTSTDLYYAKEEFEAFIEYASWYGVEVVPEIDTPAHSLALIKVFPETGRTDNAHGADQLNLAKKESRELVKEIWSEYLVEDTNGNSVFGNCDVVHIGMDEYYGDSKDYISFLKELTVHISKIAPDKKIRMWGSFSGMSCDYSTVSREIELQVWGVSWADPREMYEEGFGIINSLKNNLYIVPGTGYDWLNVDYLENEWEPNVFETEEERYEIPSYSPQMLGACYMLWNDMIMIDGIEITEEDILARFKAPLPAISQKLWN